MVLAKLTLSERVTTYLAQLNKWTGVNSSKLFQKAV